VEWLRRRAIFLPTGSQLSELLQLALVLHPPLKPFTDVVSPHAHGRSLGRCHHERKSTILDFEPARVRDRPMLKAAARESDMCVHASNRMASRCRATPKRGVHRADAIGPHPEYRAGPFAALGGHSVRRRRGQVRQVACPQELLGAEPDHPRLGQEERRAGPLRHQPPPRRRGALAGLRGHRCA